MDTNDMRYDESCKRLLADKEMLAIILKAIVPEYKDIPEEEIMNDYIQGNIRDTVGTEYVLPDIAGKIVSSGTGVEDGSVSYDVKFDTLLPAPTREHIKLIINLEGQKNTTSLTYSPVTRGVFYASTLITGQYGTVFSNSHYERIEKVYSIWICMTPNNKEAGSINRYRSIEEHLKGEYKENPVNYDKTEIVVIHIGEIEDDAQTDYNLYRMTGVLTDAFDKDKTTEEVVDKLRTKWGLKISMTMKEDSGSMCNFSDVIREEGIEQNKLDNALRMIADGELSLEKIATYTDLPLERVQELAARKPA